jgi:hypothetical protein
MKITNNIDFFNMYTCVNFVVHFAMDLVTMTHATTLLAWWCRCSCLVINISIDSRRWQWYSICDDLGLLNICYILWRLSHVDQPNLVGHVGLSSPSFLVSE